MWWRIRRRDRESSTEGSFQELPADDDIKVAIGSMAPARSRPTPVKFAPNGLIEKSWSKFQGTLPTAALDTAEGQGDLQKRPLSPPIPRPPAVKVRDRVELPSDTPPLQSQVEQTSLELSADTSVVELPGRSTVDITELPERTVFGDYSDLPEVLIIDGQQLDKAEEVPILAQIEEDMRQLDTRQQRLYELERIDSERRELKRRRDARLRELR